MESTQKSMPEDLLAKIFLPLPAKSLLQIRCVCKLWDQVIKSKSFIKSHQAHQKNYLNANTYLLLGCGTSYSTNLVDSESYNNIFESHEYDLRDICGRNLANYSFLNYGICDGLLCLSHDKDDLFPDYPIFLWNPVIRKAKKLPPLNIDLEYINHSYLCFGYHDDDYKVINMVPLRRACHVYVYSLSTDSWKFIKFDTNSDHHNDGFDIWPYPKARFVNGAAYFIYKKESECGGIVSFDLNSEIIREINFPDGLELGFEHIIMEEYWESIAILDNTGGNVVMWVLRVTNDSVLWDKKFDFEYKCQDQEYYQAMGFMNKDKLLLRKIFSHYRDDEYFLYDVESSFQQPFTIPKKLDLRKYLHFSCPWRIYELTESIVLLAETSTPCQMLQPCSANKTNQNQDKGTNIMEEE